MSLLEGLTLQQIGGLVLDFGLVAGVIVIILWTLAKSPFDLHIEFKGNVNIGRDKPDEQPQDQPATIETEQPALALEKKGA